MSSAAPGPGGEGHIRRYGDRSLIAAYGIGFCILFAFIGTFTYVNFVLTQPPLSIGQMQLGFAYLVFIPSVVTTPLAGLAVERFGLRMTLRGSLILACVGLPLLLAPSLAAVLTGLAVVASGAFLAQAATTGYVSRTMAVDRGMASGLYLASYFLGGLVGAALLGQVFDSLGWAGCVAGVALALGVAAVLAGRL